MAWAVSALLLLLLRFSFSLRTPLVMLLSRPGTSFFPILLIAALPFAYSLFPSQCPPRSMLSYQPPSLEKLDFNLLINSSIIKFSISYSCPVPFVFAFS